MWWYNKLGDNEVIISDILQINIVTAGYVLLTAKLVALKSENTDPILTLKRTE